MEFSKVKKKKKKYPEYPGFELGNSDPIANHITTKPRSIYKSWAKNFADFLISNMIYFYGLIQLMGGRNRVKETSFLFLKLCSKSKNGSRKNVNLQVEIFFQIFFQISLLWILKNCVWQIPNLQKATLWIHLLWRPGPLTTWTLTPEFIICKNAS